MSQRTFFDIRYVFPGYTFLLLIFLILFPQVTQLIQEEIIFSAIFGFIYALNGIPIGFLVSQIWYIFYYKTIFLGPYGIYKKPRKYIKYLIDNYDVVDDALKSMIIVDYLYAKYEKELTGYINRRWDIVNILGATIISIISSIEIAVYLKYDLIFLFNKFDLNGLNKYDIFVIEIGLFIVVLLIIGILRVSHEHEEMVLTFLRNTIQNKCWLKKQFPDEYFISKKK